MLTQLRQMSIYLMLNKRFDDYETSGAVFRDIDGQMRERKLHVPIIEAVAAGHQRH